ncbi:MAG: methyltransferase [Bacteroidota bacterium]|jgi:tRNA1Val (adenine37-N6)-methyltransferase|nr:methyltransferase [Bacteroidota bacterium]
MKVCTDSCLFGAWVAHKIEQKSINPKSILDIGAGTGLLSLMVAQNSMASIRAVEIDDNSYQQALQNFRESPWAHRLGIDHEDIKKWDNELKYDLIISNPPFYENDLKANRSDKNLAKHSDGLTLTELLQFVKMHLADNGNFVVLLPFQRIEYFKSLVSKYPLYLKEELLVKQTPRQDYFRGILFFATEAAEIISDEIIIKNEAGNYSEKFNFLLKDYYLTIAD